MKCVFLGGVTVLSSCAMAQWTVQSFGIDELNGIGGGRQVGTKGQEMQDTLRAYVYSGTLGSGVSLQPANAIKSAAFGTDGIQQVGVAYMPGVGAYTAALWEGTAASYQGLNPFGAGGSSLQSVRNGLQVGSATFNGSIRPGLWRGTADSWVDLTPTGYSGNGAALDTDGVSQVGFANKNGNKALLWTGTAESFVDLDPGFGNGSRAYGVDGARQVGYVRGMDNRNHATLWTGTAASWVDLNPVGATSSEAVDIFGDTIVGWANFADGRKAGYWTNSASSWVDLTPFLPGIIAPVATGVWSDGSTEYITIEGQSANGQVSSALMMRTVPEPGTLVAVVSLVALARRRRASRLP